MIAARTAARATLATALIGSTVVGGAARWQERRVVFEEAQRRAAATGRRLVVVGDPHAGMQTRVLPAYGCGDVCVDLTGCPACPPGVGVATDITRDRIDRVPDDSAVVYVSCVLEYVSDPEAAVRELMRMAGSQENLFVVSVQPWTLAATFYPGARQTVTRRPDGTLVFSPVSTAQKVAIGAALVALGVVAFGPTRRRR